MSSSAVSEAEATEKFNEGVASDNDFKDAVQEDEDEGVPGEFKVSQEELGTIKASLANDYPEDATYLSDSYILSVASKPYSKAPTERRPLDYSIEKLSHVLQWREEVGAPEMEQLVKIANDPSLAADYPSELYTKAKAMVNSLNNGSMYWHGFTKKGQPILWIRTSRKPWYPDVDAEVNALILMADAGIRHMPDGVTDFVVLAESGYPPPPNPNFMIKLLKALVRGYPDRLSLLISAPISSIVQFVMNLLLPLMPGRLASKVVLLGQEEAKTQCSQDILLHGMDDLPTFFGGQVNHDQYYPDEGKCPNRGKGTLKFDYFGMLDRLEQQKQDYIEYTTKSKSK